MTEGLLGKVARWSARQADRAGQLAATAGILLRETGGPLQFAQRGLSYLRRHGAAGLLQRMQRGDELRNDYPRWLAKFGGITPAMRRAMRERIAGFARRPLVSILMPTYNSRGNWLEGAVASVRAQSYPHWELCIADDASTDPAVRELLQRLAAQDERIRLVFREHNGHIAAASNSALELCRGEWIALMDHDDVLAEDALFHAVAAINAHPDVKLLYSDEDKIDEAGKRFDHHFKPDWDPELFHSYNLVCHLAVFDAQLVREVGGFAPGSEGAQDYDLALRCLERITPAQVHHIPRVLYHWRSHAQSTAQAQEAKPYAVVAGVRALNAHFARQGVAATAEADGQGYRVRYRLPDPEPLASIVVLTKGELSLRQQRVDSLRNKTTYSNCEFRAVEVGAGNDAKSLNAAVAACTGDLVALVSDGLEPITPDWLEEMASLACQPGVGAVGARFWSTEDTLLHAGVVIGLGGAAGVPQRGLLRDRGGYAARVRYRGGYSAVSGACLVVRRSAYLQVGGFDEEQLRSAFGDVDFCLKLRAAGYRNVWTPYADFRRHGSDAPVPPASLAADAAVLRARWPDVIAADPAYNPNLTLAHEDFGLAWPPRPAALGGLADA